MILGLEAYERLWAELDRFVDQRDAKVGDTDVARETLALRLR